MINYKMLFILIWSFIICASCNPKKVNQIEISTVADHPSDSFIIAFGSCNKQDKPQPLWEDIAAEKPDLWIWLGDNIYGDSDNVDVLKSKYDKQKNNESYKKFSDSTPIIGVWDDHDYGMNDGDRTFAIKNESKNLALNFLQVPSTAEVRKREGLYQSFEYIYQEQLIRILLLDGRYFRDPIAKINKQYQADANADILGQAQWLWLESELSKEEDILIIGCGIQFIPEEHRFEKWANFPSSRARLFNLLKEEKTETVILVSGDRHIGEISKLDLSNKLIYEITSSGLTHSYRGLNTESNKYRIGKITQKLNYGLIQISKEKEIKIQLCGEGRGRHLEVDL